MMFRFQDIKQKIQSTCDFGQLKLQRKILIYLLLMLESIPKHQRPLQVLTRFKCLLDCTNSLLWFQLSLLKCIGLKWLKLIIEFLVRKIENFMKRSSVE